MNILHRGLKSLIGHKVKTLILLLLVIILGSATASALVMINGILSTTTHLRLSLPAIIMLTSDDVALAEAGYSEADMREGRVADYFKWLTREMVHEINALPYVRDFEYFYAFPPIIYSFELEQYIPEMMGEIGFGDRIPFIVTGVSKSNLTQIEEGFWELAAGRLFTEEEMNPSEFKDVAPVLVFEEFAQVNELSVGSIFNLYTEIVEFPEGAVIPNYEFPGIENVEIVELPFAFEIVGIISMLREPTNDFDIASIQMYNLNRFMTPTWRIEEVQSVLEWEAVFGFLPTDEERDWWDRRRNLIEPTWVLYDSLYFEAFEKRANDILPEFTIVKDMSFLHRDVLTSMNSVNVLMNQVLVSVIGATLIVLTLIILLYVRDRKHEIGVYLALGEKKGKILLQILFEILSVSVLGIIFAIFIGNMISNQMFDFLLQEAFVNNYCEMCWTPLSTLEINGFGSGQMEIDELIEIFDISFNVRGVAFFSGIGLATTMLSAIVPIVFILELNPKDILLRGNVG